MGLLLARPEPSPNVHQPEQTRSSSRAQVMIITGGNSIRPNGKGQPSSTVGSPGNNR